MPRNPALLDPSTPRVRVRTVEHRFPFPIPNGWFVVATADALGPGEVRALHYFGRDLVLYRTEDDEPRLVDAYCAHLGAHLAVGGKVEGDCIRCPFHGWSYDGADGRCVDIPYGGGERIPAKARVRPYPTIERGGAIWAWHHLTEGDPFYELPVVPELHDDGWTEPLAAGVPHLDVVPGDGREQPRLRPLPVRPRHRVDPRRRRAHRGHLQAVRNPGLERETFGLGLGVVRVPGMLTFVSSVTPIDEDDVHVRWFFTVPVGSDVGADAFADQFTAGVTQDIPIWENKIYRPLPVLTKSEAGIVAHRNWSKQFYSEPVDL